MPNVQQMSKQFTLLWTYGISVRIHIKYFSIIVAPLFCITQKIQNTKVAPYTQEVMDAFNILKDKLISEPVMASGRADCHYALIKDAATGTAELAGEFGAILTKWTSTIIPLPLSLHPDS
jgi:hypothetical protein